MAPRVIESPERALDGVVVEPIDDLTRTGRFRRVARGTPIDLPATPEPYVTPAGSGRRRFQRRGSIAGPDPRANDAFIAI